MTKTRTNLLITCLAIASINIVHAQYGADGAVAAAGHWALWEVEKNDLESISDGQDLLLIANVTLALEEAKLSDISKKRYESLSNIDDDIKNALTLGQIIEHGYRLEQINENIFNIIDGHPVISSVISPAVTDLLLEQGFLLASVINAETEGQNNLMNSSERWRYMRKLLSEIDRINDLAIKVQTAATLLVNLKEFELAQDVPMPTYSVQEAFDNINEEINNLVKD